MIACKRDLLRSEVFPINHQHVTWEGVVVRRNSKPACFPCKAIETGVLLTRLHFLSDLTQFDTPVFSKKKYKIYKQCVVESIKTNNVMIYSV